MRTLLIALVLIPLAACSAKATQRPAGMAPQDAIVAAPMAGARAAFQQGAYDIAMGSLEREMQPDVLNQLTPSTRQELLDIYARSAWSCAAYAKAHGAFQLAAESPLGSTEDWIGRMLSAARSDDVADAYLSFTHLRTAAPTAFNDLPTQDVISLDDSFGALPNAGPARLQLAEVVAPASSDASAQESLSPLWLHAAAAASQKGDAAAASRFARRIASPFVMAVLRADHRFDAVVAADPAAFDVSSLAAARQARAQAAAAAQPRSLGAQVELASSLYKLDRFPEALGVLNAALAHVQFGRQAEGAYFEDPESFPEAAYWKSATLIELGRDEEALANVSTFCGECAIQARLDMWLARKMTETGRPGEALPILEADRPEGLDIIGAAQLTQMKACAYHLVGRDADAKAQLEILRRGKHGAPDSFLNGLLCLGADDDEIAATLISWLADPGLRSEALARLQGYHEGHVTPLAQMMRDRLQKVAARPDVQAALARVGRSAVYQMPEYREIG